ncbi:MAG: FAD-dependent oxidoreductase, partial [Egibacteraceae bacterium]
MEAELHADVVVAGGGLGGGAAALAAARSGRTVVLTEETDWLGGQLTAQAVPPDEHPWIERFGCTASYRRLRHGIRDHYRAWYPLSNAARRAAVLNPGGGRVGTLCHEPRVALAVIEAMLGPHCRSGRVRVLTRHRPVAADVHGDQVLAVAIDSPNGPVTVSGEFFLDATETGELLPLTGAEHVTGFEAQTDSGEPSAPAEAQPDNLQAVTVCFALDHLAGQDHTIDRPPAYHWWREHRPSAWPERQLSLVAPHPRTGEPMTRRLTPNPDDDPINVAVDLHAEGGDVELWTFRRIAARRAFVPGAYPSDVTLVNWPMVDYLEGPLYGGSDADNVGHLDGARELSRSFLYWLQTEAPRPDGGTGYPGLYLRPDLVGTADGLAKYAYIRESRRIKAVFTVAEQHVGAAARGIQRGEPGAGEPFPDSVGVGCY